MKHHFKDCLEDTSPDNLILHHGTNNLKSDDNSEKIASDIVDPGDKWKYYGRYFKFDYKKWQIR